MNGKQLGNQGEAAAVEYIERAGYRVIDTNVRPFPGMRRGEIDIVAWHDGVLCIIEVKTRKSRSFEATDAVAITKRRQLTRLAMAYVAKYGLQSTECRFDIVCVYGEVNASRPVIELIPGAFDPVY